MMCDRQGCTKDARWQVYACYDAEMDSAHPRVARYPNPMTRACGDHLTWELGRDAAARGSTMQWVVKPV
jgi:hypothetical protein